MTARFRGVVLLGAFYLGQVSGMAESKPVELRWPEVAPLVTGNHVDVTLNGGTKVGGEVLAVRDDVVVMDVSDSSGAKAFAKGNSNIPREDISLIKVRRTRGSWGRTMGTVVGVVVGLGTGGYAASRSDSGGAAVAVLVSVASAIAVGGYYAGRGLDRRTTVIKIVP